MCIEQVVLLKKHYVYIIYVLSKTIKLYDNTIHFMYVNCIIVIFSMKYRFFCMDNGIYNNGVNNRNMILGTL